MTTETLVFPNDFTPLDKLLFRRYRAEVPGLVEATLSLNTGLAALGTFPPMGTTITVSTPAVQTKKTVRTSIKLYD